MVDPASAPIVAAHDNTNDLRFLYGYKKEIGITLEFVGNAFTVIGGAQNETCALPEGDDLIIIFHLKGSYLHDHPRPHALQIFPYQQRITLLRFLWDARAISDNGCG